MAEKQDYLQMNNTRLFYTVQGEGDPIILIHGSFTDHRIWDEQVDALTRHYQVIRYDQRGFGKSEVPTANFSYFDDLKALIDALGLKEVTLVGSSFGGSVAIDFAIRYPQYVKALILAGPALNGHSYPADFMKETMNLFMVGSSGGPRAVIDHYMTNPYWSYFFPSDEHPESREKVLRIVNEAEKSVSWDYRLISILQPPAKERLGSIKAPTLIVLSDRENPANMEVGEYIHRMVPGSKSVTMDGCGWRRCVARAQTALRRRGPAVPRQWRRQA
jgi:pimeloyl-ACP methyl ester carboxylesterase